MKRLIQLMKKYQNYKEFQIERKRNMKCFNLKKMSMKSKFKKLNLNIIPNMKN